MFDRILIVDDEPAFRKVVARLIQSSRNIFGEPPQINEVGTMAEARAIVDSKVADVILLDLILPDSTREESIAYIRQKSKDGPAFVVVSGAIETQTRMDCLCAGAEDYMQKSAYLVSQPEILLERCFNAWIRRELRKANAHQN